MTQHLIIAGHQKCMTTSLYHYLSRCRGVFRVGRKKELNYFRGSTASLRGYATQFGTGVGSVTLEASPFYIFDAESLQRIDQILGDSVQVIVLRRNPVNRAISHYYHSVARGHEDRSLLVAMAGDIRRMSNYGNEFSRIHHSYLNRSNFDLLEARARAIFGQRLTIFDTEEVTLSAIARSILEDILELDINSTANFMPPKEEQGGLKNQSYRVASAKRFQSLKLLGLRGRSLLRAGILTGALQRGKQKVTEYDRLAIEEGIEVVARLNSSNSSL